MSTDNQWLSVHDVAELLQIKDETVRRWIRRDEIPVMDVSDPRTGYRIRREDLDHFIWQRYRMRHQPVEDRHFRQSYRDSQLSAYSSDAATTSQHKQQAPSSPSSRPGPVYGSLMSRVPGITYTTDDTGGDFPGARRKIVFVSVEFESTVNVDGKTLQEHDRAWWELIHPDDIERVRNEIAASYQRGTRLSIEYRLQGTGNSTIWVRDEAVPLDNESRWQGVILNVTERKQVELMLQERLHQHATLAELGDHALQDVDSNTLMDEAVEYVHTSLNVDFTKVLQLLPGGNELLLRSGVGWKPGMIDHTTVSAGAESQAGYTLLSNEPVIVDDLETETRFNGPPLLRDNGVRSGISVIIAGHGMPWGVLGAHTRSVRTFTREDVHFLQAVANILAAAIRAARVAGDDGRWLSIRDVAESLQVKDETVRRWIRRGELPIIDLGSSRAGYRIHPADLDQFIKDRYIRPVE